MSLRIYQGHSPKLGLRVFIDETAVVIGQVIIGNDSSIWPMVVIRGDENSITIGDRTNVQDGTVLHITHAGPDNNGGMQLTLGNEVTVGHNATLHGCTIGNRCLIGMGAIVLDGAVIEDDVLVAAGSVVPPRQTLKSQTLWRGNPAREIRSLTEREVDMLRKSAEHYVILKEQYRSEPREV